MPEGLEVRLAHLREREALLRSQLDECEAQKRQINVDLSALARADVLHREWLANFIAQALGGRTAAPEIVDPEVLVAALGRQPPKFVRREPALGLSATVCS